MSDSENSVEFRQELKELIDSLNGQASLKTVVFDLIDCIDSRELLYFIVGLRTALMQQLKAIQTSIKRSKSGFLKGKHNTVTIKNRVVPFSQIINDDNAMKIAKRKPSFVYTFDPEDCYLSSRIAELLFHEWALRLLIAAFVVGWVLIALETQLKMFGFIAMTTITYCIYFPYGFLFIAAMNRTAMKLVWRSFDFWIKIVYGFMFPILDFFYNKHRGWNIPTHFAWFASFNGTIISFLIVFVTASLDALPRLTRKWKIGISAFLASFYCWFAVMLNFVADEKHDLVIRIEATNSVISFQSLLGNAAVMISIFIWKQVFAVYQRKGKCISISYTPFIQWKTNKKTPSARSLDLEDVMGVHGMKISNENELRFKAHSLS